METSYIIDHVQICLYDNKDELLLFLLQSLSSLRIWFDSGKLRFVDPQNAKS